MPRTKPLFAAAALALLVGTAHGAGDAQSRDVPGFTGLDMNKDDVLSRSEARGNPALHAQFDEVDDNGDGRLNRTEYLETMALQDLHKLREDIAEFIDPDHKAPLAKDSASSGSSR